MSFRQKMAAISLAALVLMYGWYFANVLMAGGAIPGGRAVGMVVIAILGVAVIQIVGASLIAIVTREGQQPMDERERSIERRAKEGAYVLLIVGALIAATLIHLGAGRIQMANAILAAVVVAEIARYAGFLVLHHRQP
jgi:uncharacterized membrane protein YbaN (DUF454 family)